MPMTPDDTPAAALEAIRASRQAVHDRVATGGWRYDLSYSALVAGMAGSQVLENPFNITGLILCLLGLTVIFRAETRRLGMLVTGVSPSRARWVAIGLALVMAMVMLGVVALRSRAGVPPVILGVGAASVGFVVALVGSRVWRRVYRAEMGR
jgi:hypothetical protein